MIVSIGERQAIIDRTKGCHFTYTKENGVRYMNYIWSLNINMRKCRALSSWTWLINHMDAVEGLPMATDTRILSQEPSSPI